jgi:hypothetical protein
MEWKAFFNPQIVFKYPVRALGMLCAAFGVLHAPFDFKNRYLSFGFLLLCLSFAIDKSRRVYHSSAIIIVGEKTPHVFTLAALLQSLVLWPLTTAFALLCLHQLGLTPRVDSYLSGWLHSHSPL